MFQLDDVEVTGYPQTTDIYKAPGPHEAVKKSTLGVFRSVGGGVFQHLHLAARQHPVVAQAEGDWWHAYWESFAGAFVVNGISPGNHKVCSHVLAAS